MRNNGRAGHFLRVTLVADYDSSWKNREDECEGTCEFRKPVSCPQHGLKVPKNSMALRVWPYNLDNRHGILRRNVKNFTGIGPANQGRLDIQVNKRKTWAKVGQKLFTINRNDEFKLKMSGDGEIWTLEGFYTLPR